MSFRVATFLALLLGQKAASLNQRLREWCYEAEAKAGGKSPTKKRQQLDVGSRWSERDVDAIEARLRSATLTAEAMQPLTD